VTITPSGLAFAVAAATVFAVVSGGIGVWRRRIPGAPLGTTVRVGIYLSRFAAALEYYGLRRREIRTHVDTLRGDLGAVEDLDEAIQRLGPPRTLAAAVTDGMLRPSVLRGILGSALGFMMAMTAGVVITTAFIAGVETVGAPGDAATWSLLGLLDVDVTLGPDGKASTIGFGGVALLVVPILCFLLGARVWRWRPNGHSGS
jgi:hypothetical protein